MSPICPCLHLLTSALVALAILIGSTQADDTKSPAADQVKEAEKKVDTNKRQESADRAKKRAANVERQFKRRDKDQDGFLAIEEFIVIPKKLTDAEKIKNRKKALSRKFTRSDTDKDGKLSKKEFIQQLPKRQAGKNANVGKKAPKDKKKAASD